MLLQQSRQSYRNWKWKALFRRRPFYFNLLQIFLSLQWLGIHFGLNHDSAKLNNDSNREPFNALPFIFFLIHGSAFIFVFFFDYGKSLLHQTKGKRLCEWSAFSLVCVAYCLVLLHREQTTYKEFNSSSITFPMTSGMTMLILHHIGIPEPIIILIKIAVMSLWIYFLSITHMNVPEILATLMTIFALHTFGSLLEHEYFRAFRKMGEAEKNFYGSGGNQYFIKDASHALKAVHEINQQILSSDTDSFVQISPMTARIIEVRYICNALQYALLDEDGNTENYSQFPFKKVCHHVFSVLESALGGGLTLYTDENAPEVVITAPKVIFETIIFLCIFDYVRGKKSAVCCFSCDNGNGEGWTLRLQITEPENERVRLPISLSNSDSVANADNMSKAVAGSLDIGRNLLLGENFCNKDTATERLADKITSRYFKAPITQSEPEFKEGLKISTRTIPLAHDVCSVMPKSVSVDDNSASAKITQQKWLLITQRIHDGGSLSEFEEKLNSLTVPVMMMNFSQLMNKQHRAPIAVITEHHLKLLKDPETKYLQSAFNALIVLCDSNRTTADITINHGVQAFSCLYSKAPISEVFECVQEVTKSLEPRGAFMDDKNGFPPFNDGIKQDRSARMQPTSDVPSSMRAAQQSVTVSHTGSKGLPDSVNRLLTLVKRFKEVVVRKLDEVFIVSALDDRLSRIASLKGDDRKFKEPSEEFTNSEVLNGLNSPYKKKAYIIINFFIPVVKNMRQDFANKKFSNLVNTMAALSAKSTGWGLSRLSFWFTTLQETMTIVQIYFDKGNGLKDDADISFSASSPMAGKKPVKLPSSSLLSEDSTMVTSFDESRLIDLEDDGAPKSSTIDSSLSSIVFEMLDALELAIWDAALDK